MTARRLDASTSAVVAEALHQVNNQLVVIRGHVALIEREATLSDDVRGRLADINRAIDDIARTLRPLYDAVRHDRS